MANKRIKDLSTTAAVTASDDFIAVDGATNGTRKLDAYSPSFGGNLTVSGRNRLDYNSTVASHSGLWLNQTSPAVGNYSLLSDGTTLYLNVPTGGTLQFRRNNVNLGIIDGNFLLGTATNSGNGMLQLATHTTSAGGIGFGTGVSLFTPNPTVLKVVGTGADTQFQVQKDSTLGFSVLVDGASSYITSSGSTGSMFLRTAGGTTALTLDSSANATFAGNVTLTGSGKAEVKTTDASGMYLTAATNGGMYLRANNSFYFRQQSDNTDILTLVASSKAATFAGAIAIGNTVQTAASVASTHKVTIVIGGVTYYLLATNV